MLSERTIRAYKRNRAIYPARTALGVAKMETAEYEWNFGEVWEHESGLFVVIDCELDDYPDLSWLGEYDRDGNFVPASWRTYTEYRKSLRNSHSKHDSHLLALRYCEDDKRMMESGETYQLSVRVFQTSEDAEARHNPIGADYLGGVTVNNSGDPYLAAAVVDHGMIETALDEAKAQSMDKEYMIRVTQVFRAEREIIIPVKGNSLEEALESVESGAVDIPDFNDPRWRTGWDLQNEEITAA